MKKFILRCVVLLVILAVIGFIIIFNHIERYVHDDDLLYYKSAEYCSSIIKKSINSESFYSPKKITVIIKKANDDELKKYISKKKFGLYEQDYNKKLLSLYNYNVLLDYDDKKIFNINPESLVLCEFSVIHAYNYGFYLPKLEAITFNVERYSGTDLLLMFPETIKHKELNKSNFWDKIDYLLNNKLRIINE